MYFEANYFLCNLNYCSNNISLFLFFKTPLHIAVEIENPEIVSILLSCKSVDINSSIIIIHSFYTIFTKIF